MAHSRYHARQSNCQAHMCKRAQLVKTIRDKRGVHGKPRVKTLWIRSQESVPKVGLQSERERERTSKKERNIASSVKS